MNARALSLVHVISSLEGGGMEKFAIRLAARQRAHGHDTQILALRGGALETFASTLNTPLTILRGNGKQKILQAARFFWRQRGLDIIHSHNPSSLHYATLGKLLSGAKLVYTDHAQTRGIVRTPARFEWMMADAAVGCSEDTTRLSGAFGKVKNIRTIHNGIDIAAPQKTREAMRESLGINSKTVVGIMPAAFHKVKGHDFLLDTIARIHGQADVKILLVGTGGEYDACVARAKKLNLIGREIEFLGFRNDVPDLLAAADFFILPSRSEGLPLAVLEAMAAYLPVIATPVGGVPELVSDACGLLIPVDDVETLGRAILKIAESKELRTRMGQEGHKRVVEHFSFEHMTRKYEEVYRSVLIGR